MQQKLSYFDFKGVAEPIRLAFAVGGIDFEDHRFQREDWPQLKPKTPYGSVPTLTIGDRVYAQSNAILRYAGKLAGLYPTDPVEALAVDQIVDALEDMFLHVKPTVQEQDEKKKMEMRKVLAEETLPKWLGYFNKHIEENGSSGYIVGDSLTIADLKLYTLIGLLTSGMLDGIPKTIAEPFPKVTALLEKVGADEKVKAFEAKHAK
uniref:Prostaglandin-H2 D-isomerase n=1 Tax=Tetraselmis sp. GSL018 TaxID=582737 RepID=A0A061SAH2_9CHLO